MLVVRHRLSFCGLEMFPFVQFRSQKHLMTSPWVRAPSLQNHLHSHPNNISSWPIFMTIMTRGTIGARIAIPLVGQCLISSHTCIIRSTGRYVSSYHFLIKEFLSCYVSCNTSCQWFSNWVHGPPEGHDQIFGSS